MMIFSLDLSTRVGFALYDGVTMGWGTKKLPKVYDTNDFAGRTYPLRVWLRDMITVHKPGVVAFEAPWQPVGSQFDKVPKPGEKRFTTTAATLRLLISLASETETTAKEMGCRCMEVATSSAKVALAGSARLKDKKLEMVAAAWARGWEVSNDHEADAIGVALVICDQLGLE